VVQDLVADDLDHLKRLLRRDAVDEHVAVDADEVLRVEDAVLVLPGRVDDLGRVLLALVADLLAEGVLNGRVVALDEVAVDVADREGGFACAGRGGVVSFGRSREVILSGFCLLSAATSFALSRALRGVGWDRSEREGESHRPSGCQQWQSCAAWRAWEALELNWSLFRGVMRYVCRPSRGVRLTAGGRDARDAIRTGPMIQCDASDQTKVWPGRYAGGCLANEGTETNNECWACGCTTCMNNNS